MDRLATTSFLLASMLCGASSLDLSLIETGHINTQTTLIVFIADWCEKLCEEPWDAVDKINNDLEAMSESLEYEAVGIDCSNVAQASFCERFNVLKYPTTIILPQGSTGFWEYEGDREADQMIYSLLSPYRSSAIKPFPAPTTYSRATKNGIFAFFDHFAHFFFHSIFGNIVFGSLMGFWLVVSNSLLEIGHYSKKIKAFHFGMSLYVFWFLIRDE